MRPAPAVQPLRPRAPLHEGQPPRLLRRPRPGPRLAREGHPAQAGRPPLPLPEGPGPPRAPEERRGVRALPLPPGEAGGGRPRAPARARLDTGDDEPPDGPPGRRPAEDQGARPPEPREPAGVEDARAQAGPQGRRDGGLRGAPRPLPSQPGGRADPGRAALGDRPARGGPTRLPGDRPGPPHRGGGVPQGAAPRQAEPQGPLRRVLLQGHPRAERFRHLGRRGAGPGAHLPGAKGRVAPGLRPHPPDHSGQHRHPAPEEGPPPDDGADRRDPRPPGPDLREGPLALRRRAGAREPLPLAGVPHGREGAGEEGPRHRGSPELRALEPLHRVPQREPARGGASGEAALERGPGRGRVQGVPGRPRERDARGHLQGARPHPPRDLPERRGGAGLREVHRARSGGHGPHLGDGGGPRGPQSGRQGPALRRDPAAARAAEPALPPAPGTAPAPARTEGRGCPGPEERALPAGARPRRLLRGGGRAEGAGGLRRRAPVLPEGHPAGPAEQARDALARRDADARGTLHRGCDRGRHPATDGRLRPPALEAEGRHLPVAPARHGSDLLPQGHPAARTGQQHGLGGEVPRPPGARGEDRRLRVPDQPPLPPAREGELGAALAEPRGPGPRAGQDRRRPAELREGRRGLSRGEAGGRLPEGGRRGEGEPLRGRGRDPRGLREPPLPGRGRPGAREPGPPHAGPDRLPPGAVPGGARHLPGPLAEEERGHRDRPLVRPGPAGDGGAREGARLPRAEPDRPLRPTGDLPPPRRGRRAWGRYPAPSTPA